MDAHRLLPKDACCIKNWVIDRCPYIQVGTGRGHSKRRRLNEALQFATVPLLKQDFNGKQYEIMRIDFEKMQTSINDHGGKEVFGDFDLWGDVLSIRKKYETRNLPPMDDDIQHYQPASSRILVT